MLDSRTPSPIVSSSHLRVIRDEDAPPYDGDWQVSRVELDARPARKHVTMIADDVVEQVAAACGMTGSGLYVMLERRVNKEGQWVATMGELAATFGCSVRHLRDTCKALEDAGFVVRENVLGPRGATIAIRFILPKHLRTYGAEATPEPRAEPTPELSCARGIERVFSSSHSNNDIEHPPKPTRKRIAYTDDFETFWVAYPKDHGTKSIAFDEWRRLSPDEQRAAIIGLDSWKGSPRWQDGFIRDAERYLKHRMWESVPEPARAESSAVNGRYVDKGGIMKVAL